MLGAWHTPLNNYYSGSQVKCSMTVGSSKNLLEMPSYLRVSGQVQHTWSVHKGWEWRQVHALCSGQAQSRQGTRALPCPCISRSAWSSSTFPRYYAHLLTFSFTHEGNIRTARSLSFSAVRGHRGPCTALGLWPPALGTSPGPGPTGCRLGMYPENTMKSARSFVVSHTLQ